MRELRALLLAVLVLAVVAMSQAGEAFLAAFDAAAAAARADQLAEIRARCQADVNEFAEYAYTDDQGEPLVQAAHHRVFQDLARTHDRLVMWFPVEHGKSTQARILATWLLGKHPDRQYAIVKSKAKQAQKDVKTIGRIIVSNPRVREIFPDLRPAEGELRAGVDTWGAEGIRVHGCPYGLPDPSLAAYGLDGQILGARVHGLILDNVLDKANTQSPVQRLKVLETIDEELMSRVLPGGFCIIIDTAWHVDDALHEIAKRPRWHSVKFDAEQGLRKGQTLWPARFPWKRLKDIREASSLVAYNRMYRNMPLSETTAYFKEEHWLRSRGRVEWWDRWPERVDAQVELVTGVDLATKPKETADETVLATVVRAGHRRQLRHLRSGQMGQPEVLKAMVECYRAFHAPVQAAGGSARFVVEDNAAQVFVVQALRNPEIARGIGLTDEEAGAIQVVGRTTTAKKRDPELGVQSLATDIEMDRWDFPAHPETTDLREEMRVWTPDAGHYGDRLMALWIAAASFGAGLDDEGMDAGDLEAMAL